MNTIQDYTHTLLKHPDPERIWKQRPLVKINQLIIHQAMSGGTVKGINNYHISTACHISNKGCPKICYHFAIDPAGTLIKCNELTDIVWHCKQANRTSIGILVMGDFQGKKYQGTDVAPSMLQVTTLEWLCQFLLAKYEHIKQIYPHAYYGKINCPGIYLTEWIENFQKHITHFQKLNKCLKK